MAVVHVFASTGRFRSFEEMRGFIDEKYTEDGDGIPSPFMLAVALSEYEPMCIEAIFSDHPVPLEELLAGASWSDQWLHHVDGSNPVDAAICVFEPNQVANPWGGPLDYYGAFEYDDEA